MNKVILHNRDKTHLQSCHQRSIFHLVMNETIHFKHFCKTVLEIQQSQLSLKLLSDITGFILGKQSKLHGKTVIFFISPKHKNIALFISKLNIDHLEEK